MPPTTNWLSLPAGKTGLYYSAGFCVPQRFRVELYVDADDQDQATRRFDTLRERRGEIEEQFGEELEWERLESRRASRVAKLLSGGHPCRRTRPLARAPHMGHRASRRAAGGAPVTRRRTRVAHQCVRRVILVGALHFTPSANNDTIKEVSERTTSEMPNRDELFLAYRQAKAALFFERRGVGLLTLARFEQDLPRNLDRLATTLAHNGGWFDGLPEGDLWVVPKRLNMSAEGSNTNDLVRIPDKPKPGSVQGLDVQIRFTPSPEYAIVEVLFLWQFGPLLESLLSRNTLGYRLDLRQGHLKQTRRWLFEYWPKRYEQYRNTVLDAAIREVDAGHSVLLLCADLTSFYDTIDPTFSGDCRVSA